MLCVLILYISSGTYCLKSTTNDRFFEKLFMVIWFTLRVFARNLLRGNHRRNTFCILFWCLAWDSNLGFTSNKPTHYLLDHGEHSLNVSQPLIILLDMTQHYINRVFDLLGNLVSLNNIMPYKLNMQQKKIKIKKKINK